MTAGVAPPANVMVPATSNKIDRCPMNSLFEPAHLGTTPFRGQLGGRDADLIAEGRFLSHTTIDGRQHLFYCVEQMPRGDLLGSLEHIVLLALIRLQANAYGMTVRREIEERTGRNISIGAVYTTLERLQTKGYVSSLVGEPTAERGGRAKRLFRIEADGERALRASQEAIRKMTLGLAGRWGTT